MTFVSWLEPSQKFPKQGSGPSIWGFLSFQECRICVRGASKLFFLSFPTCRICERGASNDMFELPKCRICDRGASTDILELKKPSKSMDHYLGW